MKKKQLVIGQNKITISKDLNPSSYCVKSRYVIGSDTVETLNFVT